VARRVEAVRGDLTKMGAAQAAAETARLFVVEAARAPRGTRELRAADWSRVSPNGEPEMVAMRLDPAKPPQAQLDAIFNRARRLKEGARIAQARLDEAAQAHAALAELAAKLTESDADFDALEAAARAAAPRDFKMGPRPAPGARHARSGEAKPPFRTFAGGTEAKILVGRGALQNDALTLRVARPHDLWLHAKGFTGAHVVVPLPKGASCPAEVLVEAAHLAAHFSDARTEALVEVTYTPRRYVRKPRGSAPGAVVVDREKVIVLRKDDELLRALLAAEIDP
jgi:predicted ribosome quality control (RQC) complex YloA/Tae2 family protein